jgi:type II secretory pathway component GspD/PulD (secretin)
MLRVTLGRAAGLLALLYCAALAAGADDKAAEKSKRIAYVVKYGSAKELAKVLGEHLKGTADVEALPEASANVLLIRATPAAFPEVVKLLEVLDRRPRLVAVEVWVAEVLPGDKKDGPLDTKALNGPAADVLAKAQALRNQGRIGDFKRLEVTTVESQSAHAHLGQTKPLVIGLSVTATGRTSRNIMYRNFGADVRVTPRVGPDNVVALELRLQDARPHVDLDAPVLGNDENKAPIRATETVLVTAEGTVSVASGQAAVVQNVKTTAKGGQLQTLVIVTARVLDGTQADKRSEDAPPRPRPRPRRQAPGPMPPP